MRKMFVPVFMVLMFTAVTVSAQSSPDYNGTWVLDTQKTKLDGRIRIESMTLKIRDRVTEVTRETVTNRGGRGGGPSARGMGGGLGIRDGVETFSMDGREKSIVEEGPRGPMRVRVRGKREKDGRIVISTSRNLNVQMGEVEISTKETWSLSSDGKTLTVKAELSSPLGSTSNQLVFYRQ
jgi:hypothetical protein